MASIPPIKEIADRIIANIETQTGQTIPLSEKAFFRILAIAIAGALSLLYRLGFWVIDQIFLKTADVENVEKRGNEYGLIKRIAVSAEIEAIATGTNGVEIPIGTLWSNDKDIIYEQKATVIIAGDTPISLKAIENGSQTNSDVGTILTIVSPIINVNNEATVSGTTINGEDAESDESYKSRVLARITQPPQGGSTFDYINWTLEVEGIAKAFAFNNGAGAVVVYPLLATSGSNRIPSSLKLNEIETYLNDPSRKPLVAGVTAVAMIELTANIIVQDLKLNTQDLKDRIEEDLRAYFYRAYPRQYPNEVGATNTISLSDLSAVAYSAGADSFKCTLDVIGGSKTITEYYELQSNQIIKLGTITWP